jgi:hypothetical protein
MDQEDGPLVFQHACKLGLEGIVSKRMAPAVKREAEEDWGGWSARPRHSRR